jgi:hypothetical protein
MSTASNPLLAIPFAIPFDQIQPEHVEPAVTSLLAQAKHALEAVENVDAGAANYDSTLGALERATAPLEMAMNIVGHLESVASTPALREAHNRVRPDVSAFYAGIPLRPKLWQVLKSYAESAEAKSLDATRARFLEKTVDDFRRHGADLGADDKARLENISRELAQSTSRFSQNVVDATASYELVLTDKTELAGLPESACVAELAGRLGRHLQCVPVAALAHGHVGAARVDHDAAGLAVGQVRTAQLHRRAAHLVAGEHTGRHAAPVCGQDAQVQPWLRPVGLDAGAGGPRREARGRRHAPTLDPLQLHGHRPTPVHRALLFTLP